MTAVWIVGGLVVAVICSIAATYVGRTKGIEGQGALGFFLGPIGFLMAALSRPAVPLGPELDDTSRLAWMRRLAGIPWTARRDWLASIAAGLALVIWIVVAVVSISSDHGTIDSRKLDHDIEQSMKTQLGSTNPVVDCPSGESIKENAEFLCDISDSSGSGHADVTVINNNGDVRWEFIQ